MSKYIYRSFNKLRFKQKLFMSYLIVILIPISILGFYSYHQSRSLLNDQSMESINKNVSTIADSINYKFDRYNMMVNHIMFNNVIQKILENKYYELSNLRSDLINYFNPYINMIMALNKEIEQITIYSGNKIPEYGNYISSIERVKDKAWYPKVMEQSKPLWQLENKSLYVVSKFNQFANHNQDSVVYMKVASQDLQENLKDLTNDFGVLITDSEENVLFYDYHSISDKEISTASILKQSEEIVDIDGMKMIMIKKKIPQMEWVLHVFVPVETVTKKANSILNATLIVILICLILLLFIISIFSNTLIKRILVLNGLMKRVEMGDLEVTVKNNYGDEIGELTNRFGLMLRQIRELIQEAYNNKLIQKEAELKALQYQMNPHFLYNTLSFINWKAIRSKSHEISHMVTTLSTFYRTALNKGDKLISIRDEITNIKSYIEILQVMYNYRFDVQYDIDEDVHVFETINLILQPLAENAIMHGLNKRKSTAGGLLQVSARLGSGVIELTVTDNGQGMTEAKKEQVLSVQSGGYGLRNVNDRLKMFFGAEYGLSIASTEGYGTTMKVTIPMYRSEEPKLLA
ncbi:sensor histidine kinase [Paenibacillus sp. BC26]|uniref:sensor histidine kinase n=1 Tax=Paenibacillus sp. BC26 TaxID=1881032 RepID=UPI0008F0747B|nr:histidine kinase [Paenibacillus sp. BC26]SFS45768.1 two-component system, sensor histidine kinase YesM [Paenibacillus sp. BC26]